MRDFKNNRRFEGGGHDRDRQMFKATCAKCGKTCEVPFRPNGDKPIYCNDCFVPQGPVHEKSDRGFAPRREFKPRFDSQLTKPQDNRSNEDIKRAIFDINYKLDKLITLMTAQTVTSKPKVGVESKKVPDLKNLKKTLTKALKPKKEVKKETKSKKQ